MLNIKYKYTKSILIFISILTLNFITKKYENITVGEIRKQIIRKSNYSEYESYSPNIYNSIIQKSNPRLVKLHTLSFKKDNTEKSSMDILSSESTLHDWQYIEKENTIILNNYVGNNINIIIPSEINGKQVIIPSIQNINLPSNITTLIFKEINHKKVIIESSSMYIAFQNNTSIQKVDFSGLNMDNITSMENSFFGCSHLKNINFGDNTLPNLTSAYQCFFNCTNLTEIIGKLEMPLVTNLQSFVANCKLLTNLDTSQWNTQNVTNMVQLFTNCTSLTNIDVSGWNASRVSSFYLSFANIPNIHWLNMTNWNLKNNADMTQMFSSTSYSPLFLLTNDSKLLSYDFLSDWRIPYGPHLNSGAGFFKGNIKQLNFLETPAIRPSDPRIQNNKFKDKFEEFITNNIPHQTDYVFTEWVPEGKTVENAKNISDLFNTTYTAQWKSAKYSTSVDNTILTPSGELSLAYFPTNFETPATSIKNSGRQIIPFKKVDTFNIGVKDLTRKNIVWSITAQLKWIDSKMNGSYIQTNSSGLVSQNISMGSSLYDPDKDLIPNKDGVIGNRDIKITTLFPTIIMESNNQYKKNAIYDYNLGNVSLVIPETADIQIGSYKGSVEWNLILSP
ncbi:BspA family leucine-rich repeat surface protein [Enterococcus hirae]|uniref:BspA family leucine-rich repeat surface protein n=1 Tax=Enterococcus hirae TaxID=1354 RepID=UPI00109481A8|nr:BspA family leucine-rich repeat surface protein [Enterococcus hirae]TGY21262.1 BspA family leucine-rich repeat surface protein [Enterococcus hirae]